MKANSFFFCAANRKKKIAKIDRSVAVWTFDEKRNRKTKSTAINYVYAIKKKIRGLSCP